MKDKFLKQTKDSAMSTAVTTPFANLYLHRKFHQNFPTLLQIHYSTQKLCEQWLCDHESTESIKRLLDERNGCRNLTVFGGRSWRSAMALFIESYRKKIQQTQQPINKGLQKTQSTTSFIFTQDSPTPQFHWCNER